jgi:hypothetical protein
VSADTRPIDAETRATSDDHHALRLWLRLYACTSLVESRVRRRLQARFGTTLPRFDLMAQLDRSPQGLRMRELSSRLMVTGGNVTGLTDTLEDEGLVVRESDGAKVAACSGRWPASTSAGLQSCSKACRRAKPARWRSACTR